MKQKAVSKVNLKSKKKFSIPIIKSRPRKSQIRREMAARKKNNQSEESEESRWEEPKIFQRKSPKREETGRSVRNNQSDAEFERKNIRAWERKVLWPKCDEIAQKKQDDARESNFRNGQSEESLKFFAPISVQQRNSSSLPFWQRVIREDQVVARQNPGHSSEFPRDPFSRYYAKNRTKQHVWTDTAVISDETREEWQQNVSEELEKVQEAVEKAEKEGKEIAIETNLNKYDLRLLQNPEDHFCLKEVDGMGHGLFAKQNIAEG